jgi:dTMP kinase
MVQTKRKGKFIVFEGLDGSGQDTQIALLEKHLKTHGKKAVVTSEPSHNLIGGLLRSLLRAHWKMNNTGMQLLYCADRAHHLEAEVMPELQKGNNVICGRYVFSTIAYGSLNNDKKWLETLNEKFIMPDITIFFKVSPKECMRRINGSRSNTELFEKRKKLEKVFKTYLKLAADKKYKNVYVVDGDKSIDEVAKDVAEIIDRHI